MVVKVEKSRDLEWASWRRTGASGVVSGWAWRLGTMRVNGVTSTLSPNLTVGKKTSSSSNIVRQREGKFSLSFLFCEGLQCLGWWPPALERAICFTQSSDLNVNLIQKNTLRNTSNIMFKQKSGHLWLSQVDT